MFSTLYAKAEYGDITRMRPEDFLAKTSVVFIIIRTDYDLLGLALGGRTRSVGRRLVNPVGIKRTNPLYARA